MPVICVVYQPTFQASTVITRASPIFETAQEWGSALAVPLGIVTTFACWELFPLTVPHSSLQPLRHTRLGKGRDLAATETFTRMTLERLRSIPVHY